jgi:S-formylglutathione hydrolase
MPDALHLGQLKSAHLPDTLEYAVLEYAATPSEAEGPLPLCILLMGGGGSRQNLVDCKPLFDSWRADGSFAPMIIATPSAGMSYYLGWEQFLSEEFPAHLRRQFSIGSIVLAGVSMGGYGALKTAFAEPEKFAAVAAMNPMMEPGFNDAQIGARNRIHHSAGGPAELIGPQRDAELFAANQPAVRARENADRLRGLAIYIEAGDNDFVNAHDGTEFLHRALWDLDISHEYHLWRGADHGGPTFVPRMKEMFRWLSTVLRGEPPKDVALEAMRTQLEPVRAQAAAIDPTTRRRFAIL